MNTSVVLPSLKPDDSVVEDVEVAQWPDPDSKEMFTGIVSIRALNYRWPPTNLMLLRRGLKCLVLLVALGITMIAGGLGVFSSPLVTALGFASMYGGMLVFLMFSHGHGIRTGSHIVSPRNSILCMVALIALIVTSVVAGIEASIR
jgi:hypothetical protein